MNRLSPEQDVFLEQVIDAICRRGLRLPVLFALDVGRPVTFLGGQLLWLLQPSLSLLLPSKLISQTAKLLEEPATVAALTTRLEAREA